VGAPPLVSPAMVCPDPYPTFPRLSSAATCIRPKLLGSLCSCLRPLWYPPVMLPTSEPLCKQSTPCCSFLSLLVLFCAASIASSMISYAWLASSRFYESTGVCTLFCKQPLLYRTSSGMLMSSSSFRSAVSSSIDWAMLTSLHGYSPQS
jgi:hypothetical protein